MCVCVCVCVSVCGLTSSGRELEGVGGQHGDLVAGIVEDGEVVACVYVCVCVCGWMSEQVP